MYWIPTVMNALLVVNIMTNNKNQLGTTELAGCALPYTPPGERV